MRGDATKNITQKAINKQGLVKKVQSGLRMDIFVLIYD